MLFCATNAALFASLLFLVDYDRVSRTPNAGCSGQANRSWVDLRLTCAGCRLNPWFTLSLMGSGKHTTCDPKCSSSIFLVAQLGAVKSTLQPVQPVADTEHCCRRAFWLPLCFCELRYPCPRCKIAVGHLWASQKLNANSRRPNCCINHRKRQSKSHTIKYLCAA